MVLGVLVRVDWNDIIPDLAKKEMLEAFPLTLPKENGVAHATPP